MSTLFLRPAAEADALEAAVWYEQQRHGLGLEFLRDLDATFAKITEMPQSFAVMQGTVRRALVKRFPFGVYYDLSAGRVSVLAVLHLHRSPDTWRMRANGE